MSAEFSYGRVTNPIDLVEQIASLHNWACDRTNDDELTLVVAGSLNKQIANELGTSEKTIKVHRGQVMHKMHADSLPDLVRMAEKLNSVDPRA